MMVACGSATLPMRFDGPSYMTPDMYRSASQTAHTVLGIALALICCVWGALVVLPERVGKKRCYAAAGALSAAAGLYLLAWVRLLSTPEFASRDLVQRQHTAIGRCLLVAGLQELLFSRARQGERLARTHDAWFANLAVVALVFVGHPQRASRAVVAHVAIGCCLLAGAYLLASEKKANFRQQSLDAVYAGAAVAVAAVVLVAYREPAEGGAVHRGVEATCMSGRYLALVANGVALATALVLLVAFVRDARARRPRAYELAATSDGGAPPALDAAPKRYAPATGAGGPPAPDAADVTTSEVRRHPCVGGAPPAPDADEGFGAPPAPDTADAAADAAPTPPPSPPRPPADASDGVLLVVITSGGPRKHALLSAFETRVDKWDVAVARKAFGEATPAPVAGFALEFVKAVPGEACRTRARTEGHCGDVLDDLGLSDAQRDEFGKCAALARPENRRVLGCLLANLRAMRICCERKNAIIVEDNVRPLLVDAASRVASILNDGSDLLYLGHLAHTDTLALVAEHHGAAPALTNDGNNHELWGTFAYRPSSTLREAVLRFIREEFPSSIFRPRRRDCGVTPIDKLLQRVARREGLLVRCLAPPAFYRMPPVLPSKIHKKWDVGYEQASRGQLALYGLTWRDVWLTQAEQDVVAEPPLVIAGPTAAEVEEKARREAARKAKQHERRAGRAAAAPVAAPAEHFINDILRDNAVFDAETRARPFVGRDQAAALLEIFDDKAVCSVVRAKLGARFEPLAEKLEAWRSRRSSDQLGAAIEKVVEDLAADHLRPDGMLERLRGGVDAASFGVATLLTNIV